MACACNDPVVLPPSPLNLIYPYEVSPEGGPGCVFSIAPSTVHIHPFWLCPGQQIEINVVHTARGQQDYSLKVWVSEAVLGIPAITRPGYLTTWEAVRSTGKRVVLHEADTVPPADATLTAVLGSGPYLLHILNTTNLVNEFSLRLAEIGVNDGA